MSVRKFYDKVRADIERARQAQLRDSNDEHLQLMTRYNASAQAHGLLSALHSLDSAARQLGFTEDET